MTIVMNTKKKFEFSLSCLIAYGLCLLICGGAIGLLVGGNCNTSTSVCEEKAEATRYNTSINDQIIYFAPNGKDLPADVDSREFDNAIMQLIVDPDTMLHMASYNDPLRYQKERSAGASNETLSRISAASKHSAMHRADLVIERIITRARNQFNYDLPKARFMISSYPVDAYSPRPNNEEEWNHGRRVEFQVAHIGPSSHVTVSELNENPDDDTVFFTPNCRELDVSVAFQEFDEALILLASDEDSFMVVSGFSGNLAYHKAKKQGESPEKLREEFIGAKGLAFDRAIALREEMIDYAKTEYGFDLAQDRFAVSGFPPDLDSPPPKSQKEWLKSLRVEFQVLKLRLAGKPPLFDELYSGQTGGS